MKRNVYTSVIFLLLMFFVSLLPAQVLVNKAAQDTTGNPQDTLSLSFVAKDGASNIIELGNTWPTSDSEQILITKYNYALTQLWQVRIPSPSTKRFIATNMDISGGYIYVCSSPIDSVNNKSTFVTYKVSDSTGAIIWAKQYTPSYSGYGVPAAVREDSLGNVYVVGTEQTNSTSYEMTFLKYNSAGTVQFTTHYDSAGLYSGAVGMGSIVSADSFFSVSGYSGSTFGTWNIVSMLVNVYTGSVSKVSIVSNGSGSFISHPVALAKDNSGDTYIVGASEISGPDIGIKLIKYDSLFNQVFVKTWTGPDSLDNEPAYMVSDASHNLIITGYTTHASGEVDLLVLKYDKNGNFLWSRTINNGTGGSTLSAKGTSITVDNNNTIYVTGKIFNGSNYDIITAAIDPNGNTLWEKIYDGGGTTDVGMNVSLDVSNNVYVAGTTAAGSSIKYISLMYTQLPYTPTVVQSGTGIPRHATNEVIVRFKKASIINPSFFAKTDGQYSTLGALVDSSDVAKMDAACSAGGAMKNWTVERLFTGLTSSDTLSISRGGDTLRVPDFWTTLVLHTQKISGGADNAEIAVVDSLKKLTTTLVYSQLNYIGHFDATPNDPYYGTNQGSLQYNPLETYSYPDGDIHTDSAWNIATGKRFVKVGVFDSGLDYTNPDFSYSNAGGMANVFANGWDYSTNQSLFGEEFPDSVGHGTACAGIIGAVTNNSIGIAGIAGGWYNPTNYTEDDEGGVALYGAKLTSNIYSEDTLIFLSHAANAIIQSAKSGTGQNWGLNVMNNSWGIDSLETPGFYFSTNEYLLRDAVHFANRQQVVFVASRGDANFTDATDYTFTHLPACYDTSWVLNVGGSDDHGEWSSESLYGGGVDLIAPCEDGIYTTAPFNTFIQLGTYYTQFGGTSAAAPHVAGVVSLLLSYVNDSVADYSNLSQEDAEFVLEKSVRDDVIQSGTKVGYDSLSGYGFLLADSALILIKKPNYYIKHSGNSHGVSTTFTDSLVSTNVTLQFNESTLASNQYNIAPFTNYKCNVYKVKAHVNHSLGATEQIKYAWARNSASNTANLYSSGIVWPHERVLFNDYTTSYADLSNYVYKVMDTLGNFLGWYPSDTTSANTKLEYSLLIYNPAATEVQKIEEESGSILVFPNPSKNTQTIEMNLDKAEQVEILLYDMQGRFLGEVFNGLCDAGRTDIPSNISRLSSGIYLYRVQAQSFARSIKFNKM